MTTTATGDLATVIPAALKTEILQAETYSASLQKALANGHLLQKMVNTDALRKVTAVEFVGGLTVKMGNNNGANPTQLEGKCRLGGLTVDQFLRPQRDAFKDSFAAIAEVAAGQVLITDVVTAARRRRLQGDHRHLTDAGIGGWCEDRWVDDGWVA